MSKSKIFGTARAVIRFDPFRTALACEKKVVKTERNSNREIEINKGE